MIDNLRRTSLGPESGCRRTAFPDSGTTIEINGGGVQKKCLPRKRLELRRLKSADGFRNGDCESIAGEGLCFKKKKIKSEKVDKNLAGELELGEESFKRKVAVVSLTLASSSSNRLPEEDAGVSVVVGASDNTKDRAKGFTCWSHGSMMSVIGRRREMEDAVAVELGFMEKGSKVYDFFGVYDGHGGSRVAHFCRDRLHRLLAETVLEEEDDNHNNESNGLDWNKVILESFKKIDEEVHEKGAAEATMGSTAVVAVVGEEEVVVANCGDSRVVLSRGGVAMPLSNDHKPDRPDELERIELSGGKVVDWNGHRVQGVLATSRSIGDHYLKPYVIADPEVIVSKRSRRDEFLILASDGLWDVVSNDFACLVVRKCLDGQIRRASNFPPKRSGGINGDHKEAQLQEGTENASPAAEAAAVLAELAIAGGSTDNISVIVVELHGSATFSKSGISANCSIDRDQTVSL